MAKSTPIHPFKFKGRPKGCRKRSAFGEMNKLETKYAEHLEEQRVKGSVQWFKFGAIGLSLAPKTWYRPDFLVMTADNELQIHETKGFMEKHANVKIKVVAEMYPFRLFLVRAKKKSDGGGWDVQEIGSSGTQITIVGGES